MRSAALVILLVACGDDGSVSPDASSPPIDARIDSPPVVLIDAAIDSPPGTTFAITSTAYAEGGVIPDEHSCNGANVSPALAWTGAPAGTLSFAIVLTDKSNGLIHSAIYDIPSSLTSLPQDVDKAYAPADVAGAHQPLAYNNTSRGYLGPCPTNTHVYEQKVFALATATLPNATMSTTRMQLVTMLASNLGTATLTASYTP